MKRIATTLATIGVIGMGAANAATDGLLGATSTGTLDLTLTAEAPSASEVQITGLQDIDFDVFQLDSGIGLPAAQSIDGICVFSTGSSGFTYALEINAPDLVGDVSGVAIPYELTFIPAFQEAVFGVSGPDPITATGLLASTDAGCAFSASDTAELFVQPNGVPSVADTWRATMTITVIAE